MVPDADWFLYGFVRKEAVISSQIEGTQATLRDVLTFEATREAERPDDVQEVCNSIDALAYARRGSCSMRGSTDAGYHAAMQTKRLLTVVVLCGALAGSAARSTARDPAFPVELVTFGPASAEPLFAGGGADAWDRDLRERGWIMRDGGQWHLWYTGSNADRDPLRRVGHATSRDGLNWTRSSANPLVADAWVEDMCVVKRCGRYLMFAEGEGDLAHWLSSCDRVRWERRGPLDIRLMNGSPIPAGPRGTPAVWFERGVWHLFYERMDHGVWLATSRDLCTFTNVSDEPVLACGPAPYDRHGIAVDQIVKHAGRYYAYYHSSPVADRATWQTCIATSIDLMHWVKYAGNPLVPVEPAHPKRSSAMLVHDGCRYRLYTTHPDVRVMFSVQPSAAARPH